MGDVKRYGPTIDGYFDVSSAGEYVRYSDHAAKVGEKDAEITRLGGQRIVELEKALRCVLPSLESIGPNSVVEQARSALEGK